MVARVGIDADSLLDHRGPDRPSQNNLKGLAVVLDELGVVQMNGSPDANDLVDAIGQLSPDMQTLWTKTLTGLHTNNRVLDGDRQETMRDICKTTPIPQDIRDSVDLIVLGESARKRQDVPEIAGFGYTKSSKCWCTACSTRRGEPELSVSESVAYCDTVKSIRELRERGNFPEGTARQDVWNAVFAPLAKLSSEVTILDRFFLRHDSGRDHAVWFVKALDREMPPGSNLRLLGEWPPDTDGQQAEAAVRDRLQRLVGSGNLERVSVTLSAAWDKGPHSRRAESTKYGPHNRRIRFSCGFAVSSEEGFDRLGTKKITGADGFTWKVIRSPERIAEFGRMEAIVTGQPTRLEFRMPETGGLEYKPGSVTWGS